MSSSSIHTARALFSQAHTHLHKDPHKALLLYLQSAQIYSLLIPQAPREHQPKLKAEWANVLDLARKCKALVQQREGKGGLSTSLALWKPCDPANQARVLARSSTIATPSGPLHLAICLGSPPQIKEPYTCAPSFLLCLMLLPDSLYLLEIHPRPASHPT